MKKIIRIFLLLISLFIGFNSVKAERTCDDVVLYAYSGFWGNTGIYMNYAGVRYNYSLYTFNDDSGASFSSYCRNAGISAGKLHNGTKYKCKQVVFDATTSNETRKTYDSGVIAILKNGYSTRNNNTLMLEKNQEYAATSLALRVYEMLWPDLNTNGINNTGKNKAHKYYVNKWLDDEEIRNLINQAVGKIRDKYTSTYEVSSWTLVSSGDNVTENVENEAIRLLKIGLKAAINYKTNGAATLTWNETPVIVNSPAIVGNDGTTKYEKSLTYTFDATNFKSKDAYINMNFECSECENFGVDYTIYINNKEIGKTISGNLLPTGGNGKIVLKIVFKSDSKKYHANMIDFNLKVLYYDESISTEAYDMYSEDCYSNTSCQHFYMLYADDVNQEININYPFELAKITCSDLEHQCINEKNQESCERWEKEYNSNCAECQAYISNAECSDTDNEIEVKEGYSVDSGKCTVSSEANVLQCVINQKDKAGNSYKDTSLANNKYCSVWCKEDYHFTLPGNKEANSGRYFSLEASIQGTKTCYTTKINKSLFEDDYEKARQEVIQAYNNWALYYAAVNNHGDNLITNNPQMGAYHSGHYYCEPCPTAEDGKPAPKCPPKDERCGYCNGGNRAKSYYNYKYQFSFTGYNYSGATLSSVANLSLGSNTTCSINGGRVVCTYTSNGVSRCEHDYCNSKDGIDINLIYTSSGLASAAATLNSKINALNSILSNYNSCSNWIMDYNFDPKIHFWYEESYMDNVHTDLLESKGSINKSDITIQRCKSDTNESYESCSTGWTTDSTMKNESKFVCYKNDGSFGCGIKVINVSQTVRMKESINVSGDYITPTQFYTIYPSGAIVVADPEATIENSEKLENKLPIGLGTAQGVYTYTLIVKDLGEYYDSDKLGRIWGDKNSILSITLKENAKCQAEGALKYEAEIDGKTTFTDGVYVCGYKVNCPDCPVECDPEGCVNPDCPNNNCPVECDKCIYTNNNINIEYRPITPDNLNPNDRDLGANWEFDENNIKTGLELKAYATTKEIEETGETIYDIDFDNPNSDADFAVKVIMDNKMINKIRKYNDRYEDSYGYQNNSLNCYDYNNSIDGKTYEKVFCYSNLLDELLTDSNTKDNIKITVKRPLTETERKNYNPEGGYFTTWTLANSSSWKVTTQHGLSYYKSNYGIDINIGPSWK